MASFINGEEREFVKGSSKPKQDETLESKLRSKIKSCPFLTEESNVASITYLKLIPGEYFDQKNEKYNYKFEADASIDFKVENDVRSENKIIRGYFLSDGKEIQKLSDDISSL